MNSMNALKDTCHQEEYMEKSFVCRRCGHTSDRKFCLMMHLQRKIPCEPILEDVSQSDLLEELTKRNLGEKTHDCTRCGKPFNSRQGKCQHMKICKATTKSDEMKELKEQLETHKQQVEELKLLVTSTKGGGVINNHGTIHHGDVNNGTINNNTIVINGLGREDVSYLMNNEDFKDRLIHQIKKVRVDKYQPVLSLLDFKHFHSDHPSNHNLRKANKKDMFIEYHNGDTWVKRPSDDVLEQVFGYIHSQITTIIEEAMFDKRIKADIADVFMKEVGEPLDWEVLTPDYEYQPQLKEVTKNTLRKKIYGLVCDHIYELSRKRAEIRHD